MATDSTNKPGADNEELPGLEPLGRLDQVMVKQQIEIAEIALGIERRNRYRIMDTNEDILYYAIEDTELINRVFFGAYRSFKLPIFTEDRTQMLDSNYWTECCSEDAVEQSTVLGYVRQQWDPFRVNYHVENANRQVILKILGPMITCRLFGDVNIQVLNLNKEEVGVISKKWGGLAREYATDADYFSISYGEHFDTKTKAILLGALFLIDYVYFET